MSSMASRGGPTSRGSGHGPRCSDSSNPPSTLQQGLLDGGGDLGGADQVAQAARDLVDKHMQHPPLAVDETADPAKLVGALGRQAVTLKRFKRLSAAVLRFSTACPQ